MLPYLIRTIGSISVCAAIMLLAIGFLWTRHFLKHIVDSTDWFVRA